MDRDERLALVALNCLAGLGAGAIRELVRQAGSAAAVLAAPRLWTFPWRQRFQVGDPAPLRCHAEAELLRLQKLGAALLDWHDPLYPPRFHHLDHPPPVIAVRGEPQALAGPEFRVAVVGARACTAYGREQARRFGAGLAAAGAVVVSGGARGVDQAAMRGALAAGGRVVAALGSGLDRPYPPDAAGLFDEIAAGGGAVMSEFPCGTPPRRGNFPRRNRLIAALADAVVVVEASERSGSMITAALGNELGRAICAVPGPVDAVVSRGPHALIRDGACLVRGPEEVLAELRPLLPEAAEDPLLGALAAGDLSLDELAAWAGKPSDALQLELLDLELRGRVTRLPGGLYHRCGPRPGSR